jgi:hypothetical protein
MPDVFSSLGAAIIRTFDIGKGAAASDRRKVMEAFSVLALLSTTGDDVSDWLRAGQALSRVLLTLTAAGQPRPTSISPSRWRRFVPGCARPWPWTAFRSS